MDDRFNAVRVLENSYSISIVLFIYGNEGCTKGDIYTSLTKYSRMPDKISDLEDAGLIRSVNEGRAVRLYLTDAGREIGSHLSVVADIMCPT